MTPKDTPMPCPFCGHIGLEFRESSTFRWRVAECRGCGATAGEERIQTTGSGTPEEWEASVRERMVEAWNRRYAASAQPAQAVQPVAWLRAAANQFHGWETCAEGDPNGFPVYPAPARQPLTDADIRAMWQTIDTGDIEDDLLTFARAIERVITGAAREEE